MKRLAVTIFVILYLAMAQPAEAMISGKRLNQPVLFGRPACKVCVEIPRRGNAMPI